MAEIRQAGLWKAISIKDVAGPTPANLLPFAEKALVEKVARVVPQNESVLRLASLGKSPKFGLHYLPLLFRVPFPHGSRGHHSWCPQAKCNCAGCDGCNFSEHAGRRPVGNFDGLLPLEIMDLEDL